MNEKGWSELIPFVGYRAAIYNITSENGEVLYENRCAEFIHYESKSRGFEDTLEKQKRFKGEVERFQKKWEKILKNGDPYYNINLRLDNDQCAIKPEKVKYND